MVWQFWAAVWVVLLAAIALIVCGAYLSTPLGHALLALGIIMVLGWIGFALWLGNAMNSDI